MVSIVISIIVIGLWSVRQSRYFIVINMSHHRDFQTLSCGSLCVTFLSGGLHLVPNTTL